MGIMGRGSLRVRSLDLHSGTISVHANTTDDTNNATCRVTAPDEEGAGVARSVALIDGSSPLAPRQKKCAGWTTGSPGDLLSPRADLSCRLLPLRRHACVKVK